MCKEGCIILYKLWKRGTIHWQNLYIDLIKLCFALCWLLEFKQLSLFFLTIKEYFAVVHQVTLTQVKNTKQSPEEMFNN